MANGVFMGSNPARARAAGLGSSLTGTDSVVGELISAIIVEMILLAVLRSHFKSHHGG